MTESRRAAASVRTAGETPWAAKTSTHRPAPRRPRRRTPRPAAPDPVRRARCGRSGGGRRSACRSGPAPGRRCRWPARRRRRTSAAWPAAPRGVGPPRSRRPERARPGAASAERPTRWPRSPAAATVASAVSTIARTTANGRPSVGASQADSMSTASAPVAASSARPAPSTTVRLETIGPTWTVKPARRSGRRPAPRSGTVPDRGEGRGPRSPPRCRPGWTSGGEPTGHAGHQNRPAGQSTGGHSGASRPHAGADHGTRHAPRSAAASTRSGVHDHRRSRRRLLR